jgi:Mitochondrial ribosomal protein S25
MKDRKTPVERYHDIHGFDVSKARGIAVQQERRHRYANIQEENKDSERVLHTWETMNGTVKTFREAYQRIAEDQAMLMAELHEYRRSGKPMDGRQLEMLSAVGAETQKATTETAQTIIGDTRDSIAIGATATTEETASTTQEPTPLETETKTSDPVSETASKTEEPITLETETNSSDQGLSGSGVHKESITPQTDSTTDTPSATAVELSTALAAPLSKHELAAEALLFIHGGYSWDDLSTRPLSSRSKSLLTRLLTMRDQKRALRIEIHRLQKKLRKMLRLSKEEAYLQACSEFYLLRQQEEVETRIAIEQARAFGRNLGASVNEIELRKEQKTLNEWHIKAKRVYELTQFSGETTSEDDKLLQEEAQERKEGMGIDVASTDDGSFDDAERHIVPSAIPTFPENYKIGPSEGGFYIT